MRKVNLALIFPALVLGAILMAVAQPLGLSPDYVNYETFFQLARRDFSAGIESRFEPSFLIISGVLTNLTPSDLAVYGAFVAASIAAKLFIMDRFTVQPCSRGNYYLYLAIFFYTAKFLSLHELTQLRASLGITVVFAACLLAWSGRRWLAVATTALAASFHYSSLVVAPFLFLRAMERRTAILLALAIVIVLHVLSSQVLALAHAYFLVFETYETPLAAEAVNAFSLVFFPEYFLLGLCLWYWKDMSDVMRRIVTLELIGFSLLYGMLEFPVVAVRGREFFSALWTLFIVQSAVMPLRFRVLLHVFIGISTALSFYQYVILDFFTRQ